MTDIALTWDNSLYGADWTIEPDGTLASSDDLETAVILSLFSDRLDPDYSDAGGKPDHRGWWGDIYDPSGPTGSRLWQLSRSVITDRSKLLLRVNDLVREALQWLITANVVDRITVSSRFASSSAIEINIGIYEPVKGKTSFSYAWAWDQI